MSLERDKSGWRDSNPRPLRPERSALPSCATSRCGGDVQLFYFNIIGTRQAGLPDLALASLIEDQEILATARQAAEQLVEQDPELTQYPQLQAELRQRLERLTGQVVLS